MAQISVSLLGALRVELEDKPFEVDTRKAVALLAYLAVTGEAHRRDALAALLWPDYDDLNARAALRRTLSVLNKALGGRGLIVSRDSVGLDGDAVWLDVSEFRALLEGCGRHGHAVTDVCPACLAPLTEAASLHRGDFLAGFSLRDSLEFEDWQSFQAEALRRELSNVLERLSRGHDEAGEFEAAIQAARRWLTLDPLQESAHRALMQLYARTGDRTAALRQYRDCVRLLDAELGVQPLEETTHLYEAIAAGQLPAAQMKPAPSAGEARRPPAIVADFELPLLDREDELQDVRDSYAAIRADGRLIVIEGEAGIGKSRLAEEFLASLRPSGATALLARCYEGETGLAYAPFVELLRAGLAQADAGKRIEDLPSLALSETAQLEPQIGELRPGVATVQPIESPAAQSRLFAGVSDVLTALCGTSPAGMLVIEDLHWLDDASLDLLTYLVRRLRDRPICLVLTWRGEQVPAYHRLRRLLAETEREGLATHVVLQRLQPGALSGLTRLLSQRAVVLPPDFVERLIQETEGLPFFVVEYLHAFAQGLIADGSDWAVPDGGRSLLLSRLSLVSEQGRQVLAAAAVLGRRFSFESVREASGRSDEETIAAIEELTALAVVREVIGEDASPDYDFGHEKLRSLVYAETSLARRRLLHRRAAETILKTARNREKAASAAKAAYHYQFAGEDALAAEQYGVAGEHARRLHANAEALSSFQAALALGHDEPARIHEAIAGLRVLAGQYAAALTEYETAAALATAEQLPTFEHKIGSLYQRLGEWDAADRHFLAAEAEYGRNGHQTQRARMYADWSLNARRRGDNERAASLAEEALALAEAGDDDLALAQAQNILGILANARGDWPAAKRCLEHSLALAENLNDTTASVSALNNLALTYRATRELDQAAQLTRRALALCVLEGDRHREAALHNNLADLLQQDGRSEEAMEHLKQAVAIFAEIGLESGEMLPEIWKLVEW
jgi:DNA-binding SARP family transcriptional activator/predicted ATPase